jgi:hypothetical protein
VERHREGFDLEETLCLLLEVELEGRVVRDSRSVGRNLDLGEVRKSGRTSRLGTYPKNFVVHIELDSR